MRRGREMRRDWDNAHTGLPTSFIYQTSFAALDNQSYQDLDNLFNFIDSYFYNLDIMTTEPNRKIRKRDSSTETDEETTVEVSVLQTEPDGKNPPSLSPLYIMGTYFRYK